MSFQKILFYFKEPIIHYWNETLVIYCMDILKISWSHLEFKILLIFALVGGVDSAARV